MKFGLMLVYDYDNENDVLLVIMLGGLYLFEDKGNFWQINV